MFTPEEDGRLLFFVKLCGCNSWNIIAHKMPTRSLRQCKDRYLTYLAPHVRHDPWTPDEDALLFQKVRIFGQRWAVISKFFFGRPPNAVKNRWHLLLRMIQPKQHCIEHFISSLQEQADEMPPPQSRPESAKKESRPKFPSLTNVAFPRIALEEASDRDM
jgi:hypothetical protein